MLVIPSSFPRLIHHSYDWYICNHVVIIVLLERLCHHTKLSIRVFRFTRRHIDKVPLLYVFWYCLFICLYTVMPMCACIYTNCVLFFNVYIYIYLIVLIFNVLILNMNLGLNRYIFVFNYYSHVISEEKRVHMIVIKHWSRKCFVFFKFRLWNYKQIIQFYTENKNKNIFFVLDMLTKAKCKF